MKVIGVNDRRFSSERMREALAATKLGKNLRLLTENQEYFRTFTLAYGNGEHIRICSAKKAKPICSRKSFGRAQGLAAMQPQDHFWSQDLRGLRCRHLRLNLPLHIGDLAFQHSLLRFGVLQCVKIRRIVDE